MGLFSGNIISGIFKPQKKEAFYSDALILQEADMAGKTIERVIHFLILPEKKEKYSLVMCDGDKYRYLDRGLSLKKATKLLKKRFALKQQAFNTRATTLGSTVLTDGERRPYDPSFEWRHMRKIFNMAAEGITDRIMN